MAVQHRLLDNEWPGNVRELRHLAIRVVLDVEDDQASGIPVEITGLPARMDAYEKHLLREALTLCRGDVRNTTALLQLPRKTFYEKLRRHGIDIDAFRR